MDGTAGPSEPTLAPPLAVVDDSASRATPGPSSAPRPPTRTDHYHRERRDSSWREEQASLQHQLRLARAEIANLQARLGLQSNHAPFNSTSPRQTPPALSPGGGRPSHAARRKSSLSDLAASSPSLAPTRQRSSSNASASATSPRTAHFPPSSTSPRTPGRPPDGTGSVAMTRALLSSEGSPGSSGAVARAGADHDEVEVEVETLAVPAPATAAAAAAAERARSPPALLPNGLPSASASTSGAARPSTSSSNPFFGSSRAAHERLSKSAASAQSGSGRVISGLQSDLLQARTALESTRGQLRLSQRAVEFLGRQNEDLKETKERLTTEIDGLNRQLSRKERLQDEALTRARTAEAALGALRKEHAELERGVKGRMRELEDGARKAEEARMRSEREYAGLREGMRSMQDGWKDDLRWIREDLARSQKELETKSTTISSLLASRASLASTVTSSLSSLRSQQASFTEQHAESTSSALRELKLLATRSDEDATRAEELRGEFVRLKRAMVEHQAEEGEQRGPELGTVQGAGRQEEQTEAGAAAG